MDFLHDLFCYAALFITLKYIENIMSTSPSKDLENEIEDKCTEQEQNGKPKRDKITCEDSSNNPSSKSKSKTLNEKLVKSVKTPEEKDDALSSNLNLKSSSTVTTSDIIPIYEYSLKAASSTYMMNDFSTYCSSSLGNIPDSVLLWTGPDPPANLTDDYTTDHNTTDHTSEYAASSVISSNLRCSKSSMQVHVSSATTLLLNKTDISLNGFTDSTDLLHRQINMAAENIKQTLYAIETSSYKTKDSLSYLSNQEKTNLPSTSKMVPPPNKKDDVNLHPIKSASQTSESSGSITPHDTNLKGATHLHLMEMLTQVTMQSYHSHQELNDSLDVAIIDEHVKMNQSIHDSSIYSEYTNSDQFSNISGHGMEHLGEDELYGKGPIRVGHKNLLEKRFDRSPNGSMIAVLDFEVHEWNEPFDSLSTGTSKD